MKEIRIAILGAGNIARKMADTVRQMPGVIPYAIGSRDLAKAQAFAETYGIEKAYGSYEEVAGDPLVDLVYIATPHSCHAEQAKLCLGAGKHVLCEKAFTANAAEAREVLAYAKEKNRLIAEAIWPRYMPMAKTIREVVESGMIGKVYSLTGNLGYELSQRERVQTLTLGGGALLDVGVYALTFAAIAFGGEVESITTKAVLNENGADVQSGIILTYQDGRMANLFTSGIAVTDRKGVIHGDKGFAIVENVNNPESITVFNKQYETIAHYERPPQLTGFEYQVQAVIDAIAAGALECPQMPHSEIIRVMEWMDAARAQWGVVFPFEK